MTIRQIGLTHNQQKYITSIITFRINALVIFLEPDMKQGFLKEDVLSMQNEKVDLQNILTQLTEGN